MPKTPEQTDSNDGETSRPSLIQRLFSTKVLAALLTASIVANGLALVVTVCALRRKSTATKEASPEPEISLGKFAFYDATNNNHAIKQVTFSLNIALLDQVDDAARTRLGSHELRVRQGIEELLREAHGTDFTDPALANLKRQFQTQVNETLDMRAVADVIITDLRIMRDARTDMAPDAFERQGAAHSADLSGNRPKEIEPDTRAHHHRDSA